MEETIVKVDHLSHRYSVQWAIRDINFEVPKHGIYGLLGSNGAGKSTTMNIMCGVLRQSEGDVYIKGISMSKNPVEAKRHIGFLPQNPPLHMDLTVTEYLEYCAALRYIPDREIPQAVKKVLERCGISHFSKRLLRNLSGGYQQRVGIAQAIIHNPDFVVLDEPTNGLDLLAKKQLMTLLKDYVRHHQASIFITSHDASFIEKVSTRVVVIQEGRLYREGTFEEIFGNVHQHEVYHLLLDKSAESVLKQRFPELDYKVLDGGISVETRNPDLYRLLLEETEVLQFTREPASLEDLLYEVLK